MNKAKKAVWAFSILAVIVIAALWIIAPSNTPEGNISADKIIFYYGITCPHCKNVEVFMDEKNADSILPIERKEVYLNKTNADELIEIGKICKIDKDYIGAVPLTYFNGTCFLGDTDSIAFLEQKLAEVSQ